MEFIVNNKKYAILNHELYINYLMVNEYFRTYAKYDYDIHFDFLDSILSMDRIDFDDILEGIRNNYTDRHVNDVAAGDKGFKVFEETRGLILDFLFHEFFPF